VLGEVRAFARARPDALADLERVDIEALSWPCTREYARRLRGRLLYGERWCHVQLGTEASADERRLLFLAIGAGLGTPLTTYGRLYAVCDRGADYRTSTAPVSMTRERTGFHTDSSARDVVPSFVGLLCERPALEGGESLVSDALAAGRAVARRAPEAWRLLQRAYVRDLVTPGLEPTPEALAANRFPVFARDPAQPHGWTFRYMRYWLERGQERAGEPVSAEVRAALDLLDEELAAPEHVVRFRLDAGDMLWVDNRTLAHDRSAFTDDPAAPRLLWRMWVEVR